MENERAARLQSALGYFVAARVTISGIAFYLLLGGLDMAFDWSRHVSGHCEDLMDAIALFLAPIALFAGWVSRRAFRVLGMQPREAWLELGATTVSWAGLRRLLWAETRSLVTEASTLLGLSRSVSPVARQASETEIRDAVAGSLSAARRAAAMTQQHLADATLVDIRTVQRAEGSGRVSFENLRAFCSVLAIAVPVPEGRNQSVEPVSVWRNAGRPIAISILVACTAGLGLGWVWIRPRYRILHCMAGIAVGGATWEFFRYRGGLNPFSHPYERDLYVGLALLPACGAIGSVLAGMAWRSSKITHAAILGIAAVFVGLEPSSFIYRSAGGATERLIWVSGVMRTWNRIGEAEDMASSGARDECLRFLKEDVVQMTFKAELTGIALPEDESDRYVAYRTSNRSGPAPSRPQAIEEWKSCEAGVKAFRAKASAERHRASRPQAPDRPSHSP